MTHIHVLDTVQVQVVYPGVQIEIKILYVTIHVYSAVVAVIWYSVHIW